jgi:hypothetical protein
MLAGCAAPPRRALAAVQASEELALLRGAVLRHVHMVVERLAAPTRATASVAYTSQKPFVTPAGTSGEW